MRHNITSGTGKKLHCQQLLCAGGGLSDQQYSQYQNAVSSAQVNYDQAKYNYETQLEYSQITAPMEGLVEICNVENYDNVSQGNLIFDYFRTGKQSGIFLHYRAHQRLSERRRYH